MTTTAATTTTTTIPTTTGTAASTTITTTTTAATTTTTAATTTTTAATLTYVQSNCRKKDNCSERITAWYQLSGRLNEQSFNGLVKDMGSNPRLVKFPRHGINFLDFLKMVPTLATFFNFSQTRLLFEPRSLGRESS